VQIAHGLGVGPISRKVRVGELGFVDVRSAQEPGSGVIVIADDLEYQRAGLTAVAN